MGASGMPLKRDASRKQKKLVTRRWQGQRTRQGEDTGACLHPSNYYYMQSGQVGRRVAGGLDGGGRGRGLNVVMRVLCRVAGALRWPCRGR